jgi:hypothetical protein
MTYFITKKLGIYTKPRIISFVDKMGNFGTGILPEVQLILNVVTTDGSPLPN